VAVERRWQIGPPRIVLQTHLPKPAKRNAVQLPSFKMSDKSLFAVLLRSPWWISFALAVAVGAACFKLFPDRFAIVGALSGLPFAVIGGIAMWKQRGIPNPARVDATLQTLAAMSAREFANALEAAYAKDGCVVSKVTATGADLSITKAGRTALVNSKRWKAATHGIEPVRELSAAMQTLDANQGVYIAVNALSDAARTFASKNSIRVMQGTELALLMKNAAPPK
jgi:restriction system protein